MEMKSESRAGPYHPGMFTGEREETSGNEDVGSTKK